MSALMSVTAETSFASGFASDVLNRLEAFQQRELGAEKAGAETATKVTRSSYRRLRPLAPKRGGRSGTGQMARAARWRPVRGGYVAFNLAEMDQSNPHWIIQEIGTGKRAVLRAGNLSRPSGRPAAGATYVRTVKAQKGRRISAGLVFASGPRGKYTPPIAARTAQQNLYLASRVQGVPSRRSRSAIRIEREIKGQHFVKKGGEAGFREYRESVLAAARQQFRGARR